MLLFIKSHQAIRVAAEIGFSTQHSQAYDLARSSIDTAVIAHKVWREPALVKVFLAAADGKTEKDAFNRAFVQRKKENLFPARYPAVADLHEIYCRFSDWGTHPSVYSVGQHYRSVVTGDNVNVQIAYTSADLRRIGEVLYDLIRAFLGIERAFHDAFSSRLALDPELQRRRAGVEASRKAVAARLLRRFRAQPPRILEG